MPPGPLRQWQTLLPSVARCPALRLTPFDMVHFRRHLSTAAEIVSRPVQHSLRYRKTIVVSSHVDSVKPEHLLREIDPAPRLLRPQQPLAVFLLTPTFSKWLLDDQTFLIHAMRIFCKAELADPAIERRFHSLAAVVDKLPTPTHPGRSYRVARGVDESAPVSPPFSEFGFEGTACVMMDTSELLPSHMEPLRDSSPGGPSQAPGTINFHVSPSVDPESKAPIPSSVLQLPLANTIFHTGQSSTMLYTTWKKDPGSKDLRLENKQQMQHTSLHWPTWHSSGLQSVSLTVPVTPITIPRRIDAGMGNIIRRIEGDFNQVVPASQELEATVPRYFAARSSPARALKVWALVMPTDAFVAVTAKLASLLFGSRPASADILELDAALQRLWQKDRPVWNDAVSFAMSRGARLHRVLSGGGGWGKKAGLLSLDPELSYNEPMSVSQDADIDMLELFDVQHSALKEVARPGEFIQFFVSGAEDIVPAERELSDRSDYFQISPMYLELGTIPSTIDYIQSTNPESQTPSEIQEPEIHVFRGLFGALSEGGMSITRKDEPSADKGLADFRSKVDVPLSRFTVVQIDKIRDGKAVLSDEMKAKLAQETHVTERGKQMLKRAAEQAAERKWDFHRITVKQDINPRQSHRGSASLPYRTSTLPPDLPQIDLLEQEAPEYVKISEISNKKILLKGRLTATASEGWGSKGVPIRHVLHGETPPTQDVENTFVELYRSSNASPEGRRQGPDKTPHVLRFGKQANQVLESLLDNSDTADPHVHASPASPEAVVAPEKFTSKESRSLAVHRQRSKRKFELPIKVRFYTMKPRTSFLDPTPKPPGDPKVRFLDSERRNRSLTMRPKIRFHLSLQRNVQRRSLQLGMKARLRNAVSTLVPAHLQREVKHKLWSKRIQRDTMKNSKSNELVKSIIPEPKSMSPVFKEKPGLRIVRNFVRDARVPNGSDPEGTIEPTVVIQKYFSKKDEMVGQESSHAIDSVPDTRHMHNAWRSKGTISQTEQNKRSTNSMLDKGLVDSTMNIKRGRREWSGKRIRRFTIDSPPRKEKGRRKQLLRKVRYHPSESRLVSGHAKPRVRDPTLPSRKGGRVRRTLVESPPPKSTKREILDPEVAQLIDEVESWLNWGEASS